MAQRLAQATHNRLVEGSNPSGPTDFALFFFLNLTRINLVYLTQKTMMKSVITQGFTTMRQSSTGDLNVLDKGTRPAIIVCIVW